MIGDTLIFGNLDAVGLSLLHRRNALGHPNRFRGPFQVVIEELLHSDRPVLSILALDQVVVLSVIDAHPDRLFQTPEGSEVLYALPPGHGPILIVVHQQERGLYLVSKEHRRVLKITLELVPRSPVDAALGLLVLELSD